MSAVQTLLQEVAVYFVQIFTGWCLFKEMLNTAIRWSTKSVSTFIVAMLISYNNITVIIFNLDMLQFRIIWQKLSMDLAFQESPTM